jgi:histidinol-phosphate/aromatic aminotransferase/cobyric acid decarboxylase-like protein/GNAT superfamily N-acetyltransferase
VPRPRYLIAEADARDRETIALLRHDIYAHELHQYAPNAQQTLGDDLDRDNVYLVVRDRTSVAGFISLTLPRAPTFSIDKYFDRGVLPCAIDAATYEVRLLSVQQRYRGAPIAGFLAYAAYRWITAHGGTRIVAIGRTGLISFYERMGLHRSGLRATSGAQVYKFMWADDHMLDSQVETFARVLERYGQDFAWNLSFPFARPAPCYHGGAFFKAIGERFDALEKSADIINADVLDAWFDPALDVVSNLTRFLPWLMKTSPPTQCAGLIDAIATARGVPRHCILPGAGSSDLIFRAFQHFLNVDSRVLILDPTYGEYAHVLERVVGCRVDRFALERSRRYDADLADLAARVSSGYDLVVFVNPNSPTGRCMPERDFIELLELIPSTTRVWIDETYIDYVGAAESLESFAAASSNVIVCKSMSKVYALSGARVGYLCAAPQQLERLRAITPPWVVALPSQVAAVAALESSAYYQDRYRETHVEREIMAQKLAHLGYDVIPGVANFLLCHVPEDGPTAREIVTACQAHGIFLRDAGCMSRSLGEFALRVAIRSRSENVRIHELLSKITKRPALCVAAP